GKISHDVTNFVGMQGARCYIRALWPQQTNITFARDRTGADGNFAIQKFRIGYPAYVPQLHDDFAAPVVHRLGDLLPAIDLGRIPNAGRVRITDTLRRDGSGFR